MSKEDFEEIALTKMKEIIDAYRQLGEDDYLHLCWSMNSIVINNVQPTGGTPEIDIFRIYPEED